VATHKRGIIREGVEADKIRAIEYQRLRALVEADLEVACRLHADDFQLIDPSGESLSKEEYLGAVASGEIDYLVWEPDAIEVRLSGEMALIRYASRLELVVGGQSCLLGTTGTRTPTRGATGGGRPCGRKLRRYGNGSTR
jgi:hypothetical protein